MKTKNDVRSRSCYNDVGDIHITYEINQETGKPVKSIRATILSDDNRIGVITAESDGRMYISFDHANDISYSIKKEVTTSVLSDIESVFNEPISIE